jgi:hypothetical protein
LFGINYAWSLSSDLPHEIEIKFKTAVRIVIVKFYRNMTILEATNTVQDKIKTTFSLEWLFSATSYI